MTPSELKSHVDQVMPLFFSRDTMKFFGDTMKNYGVCSGKIDTLNVKGADVWVLYRKNPVKYGINSSSYFNKKTFKREHEYKQP